MIEVYVANNEQMAWNEEEIGYPTLPMPTKKECGWRQTGDYCAVYNGKVVPILVERKSLQDAYGSFLTEKNRARLYAEIDRYHKDDRFDEFVIIVEATRKMFMAYFPWAVTKWHKQKGDLPKFCATFNKKKVTVLEHLEERGAEIIFADNRRTAASVFSTLVAARIATDNKEETL